MRMLKNTAKRQAGYLLLEATLAFSVAAGLMTFYIRERAVQATEDLAKAHGEQMKRIADAVNQYALENFAAIINNAPVTFPPSAQCPGGGVVADARRPTLGELSCIGVLPAGVGNAQPMFGGGYQLELMPRPAGCVPGTCRIGGMLMTTAPVSPNGQLSAQVIGRSLQAIGAAGGATGMGGQACAAGACPLFGFNGAWVEPNILAGIAPAAGLMGVQVGNDPDLWLRLDGTSTMRGDIQVGGNAVDLARRDAANAITGRGDIRNANEVSLLTLTTPDATTPIRVNRNINMGTRNIDNVSDIFTRNLMAQRNITAEGINAVHMATVQGIWAGTDVVVGGLLRAHNDIQVNGQIRAPNQTLTRSNTTFSVQIGPDANNGYLCPAGYVISGLDCTGSCGSDHMTLWCTKIALE